MKFDQTKIDNCAKNLFDWYSAYRKISDSFYANKLFHSHLLSITKTFLRDEKLSYIDYIGEAMSAISKKFQELVEIEKSNASLTSLKEIIQKWLDRQTFKKYPEKKDLLQHIRNQSIADDVYSIDDIEQAIQEMRLDFTGAGLLLRKSRVIKFPYIDKGFSKPATGENEMQSKKLAEGDDRIVEAENFIRRNWYVGGTSSKEIAIEKVTKQFGLSKWDVECLWEIVNLEMFEKSASKKASTFKVADYFDDIYHKNYSGILTDNQLVEIAEKYGAEYSGAIIELERLLSPRYSYTFDECVEKVIVRTKDTKYPVKADKLIEVYEAYLKDAPKEAIMYETEDVDYVSPEGRLANKKEASIYSDDLVMKINEHIVPFLTTITQEIDSYVAVKSGKDNYFLFPAAKSSVQKAIAEIDNKIAEYLNNVYSQIKENYNKSLPQELKDFKPKKQSSDIEAAFSHQTIQTSDLPKELTEQIINIQQLIKANQLTNKEDEKGWVENGKQKLLHTTILFGIDSKDTEKIKEIVKQYSDVEIEAKEIEYFDNKKEEHSVAVVKCESKGLTELHDKLKAEISNKETYPDYKPHITIAYLKFGERIEGTDFKPVKFKLGHVEVSQKDGSLDKVSKKSFIDRVLSKLFGSDLDKGFAVGKDNIPGQLESVTEIKGNIVEGVEEEQDNVLSKQKDSRVSSIKSKLAEMYNKEEVVKKSELISTTKEKIAEVLEDMGLPTDEVQELLAEAISTPNKLLNIGNGDSTIPSYVFGFSKGTWQHNAIENKTSSEDNNLNDDSNEGVAGNDPRFTYTQMDWTDMECNEYDKKDTDQAVAEAGLN